MNYEPPERDSYTIPGGCWCSDERTVRQLRAMGHDENCTRARRGWAANMRHLRALDAERREAERIGREVLALVAAEHEQGHR